MSSQDIKETLAEKFGGAAKDWERLSKRKNPEAQIEREFRNKATNVYVTVTETQSGDVYAVKPVVAAPAAGTLPMVDTDPARIAAAQRILKRTLLSDEGISREDLSEATLNKAGDLAYANLFLFAIVQTEPGQYMIYVAAKALFERDGFHDDDTYLCITGLLPRYTNDPSGCNNHECDPLSVEDETGVPPAPALPIDAARDMLERGFFWSPAYQKAAEDYPAQANLFDATQIQKLIDQSGVAANAAPKHDL